MPAKILVVDDTPHNVKLLADLLSVKGYAVATAATGEEALGKLASESPDLVLLDVMMPGLSGYDVCRRIREDAATALLPVVLVTSLDPAQERVKGIDAVKVLRANPETAAIPVVAVTASVMQQDRTLITEAGFDGYIGKPINLKEFLERVNHALAKKA